MSSSGPPNFRSIHLGLGLVNRGVNLYVFHVSLTDFHCFDWLTYVRGNPYGLLKKKKIFFFFFFNYYFFN